MPTKNIVPRADNEGGIGRDDKRWNNAYINSVNTNTIIFDDGFSLTVDDMDLYLTSGDTSKRIIFDNEFNILETEVTSNFETLDNKIDTVEIELSGYIDNTVATHNTDINSHKALTGIPDGWTGYCQLRNLPVSQVFIDGVEAYSCRITEVSTGVETLLNRLFTGTNTIHNNRAVLETVDSWSKWYLYAHTDNFWYISQTIGETTNALKGPSLFTYIGGYIGQGTLTDETITLTGAVLPVSLYTSSSMLTNNGGAGRIVHNDQMISWPANATELLISVKNCSNDSFENCVYYSVAVCGAFNSLQSTQQYRASLFETSSTNLVGTEFTVPLTNLSNNMAIVHVFGSGTYRQSESIAGTLSTNAVISPIIYTVYWR